MDHASGESQGKEQEATKSRTDSTAGEHQQRQSDDVSDNHKDCRHLFRQKVNVDEQRSNAYHHVNNDVADDGDLEEFRVYRANKIVKIGVKEQEQEQVTYMISFKQV